MYQLPAHFPELFLTLRITEHTRFYYEAPKSPLKAESSVKPRDAKARHFTKLVENTVKNSNVNIP
jgi:hypothetical protein